MTKKPKTTTRRAPKLSPAPRGLSLLFSMLREEDEATHAPAMYASRAMPIAQTIAGDLYSEQCPSQTQRLLDAVPTIFGRLNEPEDATEPSHVAYAAFKVGVATAWLLMTELQGGAR